MARRLVSLIFAGVLALSCRRDAGPVAPTSPATGGDLVVASAEPPTGAAARPWRDALRGDRSAIRIPEYTPTRGAATPLVTIVHFGDFTDARSIEQAKAIAEALRRWPDDVRLAFVAMPATGKAISRQAAQSVAAAGAKDEFWALHDRLFATPPQDEAALERVVAAAGLDVAAWRQALADRVHQPWVDTNVRAARALGISRTGFVSINGRTAPKDAAAIVAMVEDEREATSALVAGGLPRDEVYAEILAVADVPKPLGDGKGGVDVLLNYAVPTAGRPVLGNADARVTIIVFSDFQCPFCARAQQTLAELHRRHPDDVRFVFRNNPLAFHRDARTLAKVALAADRFGKFWPMHDLIFEKSGPADWKPLAKRLRLDPRKLGRAIEAPELEQAIVQDIADATAFGASGTPTFFVNGRILVGAQPIEAFETLIAEERVKADEFAATDPGGAGTFYDRLIEGFAGPVVEPKL